MGALAQQFMEPLYFQLVSTPILYAKKVLDRNHDGLLSVSEAKSNPGFSSIVGNLTLHLTIQ